MSAGIFEKAFKPAWWLRDGHSQTLWRKFFPPTVIAHRRQRVELNDGDFIDLDWAQQVDPASSRDATIVVIQHGLCGCSGSPYVIALQSLLASHGVASTALNFRSCSGEINRLAKTYHSGISEDTQAVFNKLTEQFPRRKFIFIGYSLGANVLLKWLGEIERHPQLKKAVAVSTPFSLALCSGAMLSGVSRFYGDYFVRRLVQDVESKKRHLANGGNKDEWQRMEALGEVQNIRSIWEFDDKVTAPLHGFRDAADYYEQCSSQRFIDAIKVDTLLIQSRNDPMIPPAALPNRSGLPANVELELQDHGGHVGFISGNRDNWLEQRIVSFVLSD